MTFSDPSVAAYINKHFVSAWFNRGPGFNNQDFATESRIFAGAMESYPTRNICTFFLAPGGKTFHYVAGFYSPEVFMPILNTAVKLRGAAFDEKMALKPDAETEMRTIHEAAAKQAGKVSKYIREKLSEKQTYGYRDDAPQKWQDITGGYKCYSYRGVRHVHSNGCAQALLEGFTYFKSLHDHWAKVKTLPDLKDVQKGYLYGNSFTEEVEQGGPKKGPGGWGMQSPPPASDVDRPCDCD